MSEFSFNQQHINVYQQVLDPEHARTILAPLLKLESASKELLDYRGQHEAIRAGRFKRRVRATFSVQELFRMLVPTKIIMAQLNTTFDSFLVYQYQGEPSKFDLYLVHAEFVRSKKFDKAILEFVALLVNGKDNLLAFTFQKGGGNYGDAAIKYQMLVKTGFQLQHVIVDSYRRKESYNDSQQSTQLLSQLSKENGNGTILFTRQGKVFDVHEFARGCIKVMENLMFFTQNITIRSLQMETNTEKQIFMLRLLDHRSLIQELWNDTIDFALSRPGMEEIAQSFTQEQISILFNCNRQAIVNTFNLFALGQTTVIAQPHPVRALLDHIPFLMVSHCFDLSWYSFGWYGLNALITSYYIGKNFLTYDQYLTNNQGAICFNGAPGSGKSRLSSILYEFMNGFNYQDSQKGITEFQNFDIVSKSFIRAEEVSLKRLSSSDWKMLADIEVAIKCRVKNQQDVEVTKFVPVVITSNGNLYEEIISQIYEDLNQAAALRRWGFIRYFETWNQAHPELVDGFANGLLPQYTQLYQHKGVNQQLMNTLIGCALTFSSQTYVVTNYNIGYYTHCLRQFSHTIFGQLLLSQYEIFMSMCKTTIQMYQSAPNKDCLEMLRSYDNQYRDLLTLHIRATVKASNNADCIEAGRAFDEDTSHPVYLRCLQFSQKPQVKQILELQGEGLLLKFLRRQFHCKIYTLILEQIEAEQMWCNEILTPCSDGAASMQYEEEDSFDIDSVFKVQGGMDQMLREDGRD